jgi:hypothetical protein
MFLVTSLGFLLSVFVDLKMLYRYVMKPQSLYHETIYRYGVEL